MWCNGVFAVCVTIAPLVSQFPTFAFSSKKWFWKRFSFDNCVNRRTVCIGHEQTREQNGDGEKNDDWFFLHASQFERAEWRLCKASDGSHKYLCSWRSWQVKRDDSAATFVRWLATRCCILRCATARINLVRLLRKISCHGCPPLPRMQTSHSDFLWYLQSWRRSF